MRKEEMSNTIKVKEIFKLLSDEKAYREIVNLINTYISGNSEVEETEKIITSYSKIKSLLSETHRKKLKDWISNKDSFGLTEGLIEKEGVTRSEEDEGRAGKYIVLWYMTTKEEIGLIANHQNSIGDVKRTLELEMDELGSSFLRDMYVVDVDNREIVDFILTINKETGELEVRFVQR